MNISMGQAANALARLIDAKINLSIPKIVVVGATEFQQMFLTDHYWFTRQSFLGSVKGEVLTLLARAGTETIGGLIAHEMGHVPKRGEVWVKEGVHFVVLHTKGGAVKWFKVMPVPTGA